MREERVIVRMGCSSSKANTNVAMRVLEYQHLAATENEGLSLMPAMLDTEEWRDGLIRNVLTVLTIIIILYSYKSLSFIIIYVEIEWLRAFFSARALFNMFHSGYCSAYIQNPAYLLLVDFRTLEDWIVERVITSNHHERLLALDRSKMI